MQLKYITNIDYMYMYPPGTKKQKKKKSSNTMENKIE